VVKPEWGTKRSCQSCGARFYDFHKTPIVCPACGATFELEQPTRSRRQRPAAERPVAAAAAPAAAAGEDDELETAVDEEEADDNAYEDADELSEDADVDVVPPEEEDNS